MAGLVDAFCLQMLPQAGEDFLLGLCDEYRITVVEAKREDKAHLVKVLLRHLTSEAIETSADAGAAIFLKLYKELGGELKSVGAKIKPDADIDDSDHDNVVSETLSYRKLRLFKINGNIGDPGQKNCISHSSLLYQISQGEEQGYTLKEIAGGVIRAIEAGNPFRDVLELAAKTNTLTNETFLKCLRSHFMIRDPTEILNELRTAVQGPQENAHKFCCRCVALKKKVESMYEEEGATFDEENLSATFFRAISTGLRQNNIRNELRQVLKDQNISDHDLLYEVSLAVANEEERLKKMVENGKKVNVNLLTCESDSDDPSSETFSDSSASMPSAKNNGKTARKSKAKPSQNAKNAAQNAPKTNNNTDSLLVAEVRQISSVLEKLAASNDKLTAEVNVLKKMSGNTPKMTSQFDGDGNLSAAMSVVQPGFNPTAPVFQPNRGPVQTFPQPRRNQNNRMVYLCQNCVASKCSYCRHCFKCGKDDHKINNCPEN